MLSRKKGRHGEGDGGLSRNSVHTHLCVCTIMGGQGEREGVPAFCIWPWPLVNLATLVRVPKIPTKCTEIFSVSFVLHT